MLDRDDQTHAGSEIDPPEADVGSTSLKNSPEPDDAINELDGSTVASSPDPGEAVSAAAKEAEKSEAEPDVEHIEVVDDPRTWSARKKNLTLAYISYCSLSGATLANIYFPAISQVQSDLHAGDQIIALSASVFILMQGVIPIFWSMISELYGRKPVYIVAAIICFVGVLLNGLAQNAASFLAFRILSGIGSAAVLTLGGGTLADMYDPHERGTRVGIFYVFPLLGPSLGPIIGGVLTSAGGWRAPFYLMTGYTASTVFLSFFFKDTFRPERSAAWQAAAKRYYAHLTEANEFRKALPNEPTPEGSGSRAARRMLSRSTSKGSAKLFKPSISDLSPFTALRSILLRKNNALVIFTSGIIFASQFQLSYAASLTFAAAPYNYSPLVIGFVLLASGLGNVLGSIFGGRYSDIVLRRLTTENGGVREPEMRIPSAYVAMLFVPPSYVAYAWTVDEHVSIAGPIIALFASGMSVLWVYATSLSYIVDANPGRASTAIAFNSACRGSAAFVAIEIAKPLTSAMGTGWLFTGWAIAMVFVAIGLVIVAHYGKSWREDGEEVEKPAGAKSTSSEEKGDGSKEVK